MAAEVFEIPLEQFGAVYNGTRAAANSASASAEVHVEVFLGLDGNQEMCVYRNKPRVMCDVSTSTWYWILNPPIGSTRLPPCSSMQRTLRVECRHPTRPSFALYMNGHCRDGVVSGALVMTCLRNLGQDRFYFHQDPLGNLLGLILVFRAPQEALLPNESPPAFVTVPPRVTVNKVGGGGGGDKRGFEGGGDIAQKPKPPQVFVQLTPDRVQGELARNTWAFLESQGLRVLEKALMDPMFQPLGPSILQAIIDQNLLSNMIRSKEHHALALGVVTLAQPNHYVPFLLDSIDWSKPESIEVLDFLVAKCGTQPDVLLCLIERVRSAVPFHLSDPIFFETLLAFIHHTAPIPNATRSVLLTAVQSPVYLFQMATSPEGAQVLLGAISRADQSAHALVADLARTFGYGQTRLVLAVGTTRPGCELLVTLIGSCVQGDMETALFDFRDALSESVPRLSVHPEGYKIVLAALDHPFFKAKAAASLFFRSVQDRLPRALPALVHALRTEKDPRTRKEWFEHVSKHLALLSEADREALRRANEGMPT